MNLRATIESNTQHLLPVGVYRKRNRDRCPYGIAKRKEEPQLVAAQSASQVPQAQALETPDEYIDEYFDFN